MAKKPPRISYAELVAKIQKNKLTEEQLQVYFVEDPTGAAPFSPKLALAVDLVDIEGIEQAATISADALAQVAIENLVAKPARARAPGSMRGLRSRSSYQIVAEGDSWFDLPSFIFPPTLVDYLDDKRRIFNIAAFGDELEEMVDTGEHLAALELSGAVALMFSGGGNDVVGNGRLQDFVRQRASGDLDPNNAPRYIHANFFHMLDRVIGVWEGLCDDVESTNPGVTIFAHGYDYVIPRVNGYWLGTPLEFRGFHPHWQRDMARAVIRFMMDCYNARLEELQANRSNFRYVNLLGTVKSNEWRDELHARANGAKRLAKVYNQALTDGGVPPAFA